MYNKTQTLRHARIRYQDFAGIYQQYRNFLTFNRKGVGKNKIRGDKNVVCRSDAGMRTKFCMCVRIGTQPWSRGDKRWGVARRWERLPSPSSPLVYNKTQQTANLCDVIYSSCAIVGIVTISIGLWWHRFHPNAFKLMLIFTHTM